MGEVSEFLCVTGTVGKVSDIVSISSPSNLPLCLEAAIYSWPLSLKYVPSSGPGRQMCVHHTSMY